MSRNCAITAWPWPCWTPSLKLVSVKKMEKILTALRSMCHCAKLDAKFLDICCMDSTKANETMAQSKLDVQSTWKEAKHWHCLVPDDKTWAAASKHKGFESHQHEPHMSELNLRHLAWDQFMGERHQWQWVLAWWWWCKKQDNKGKIQHSCSHRNNLCSHKNSIPSLSTCLWCLLVSHISHSFFTEHQISGCCSLAWFSLRCALLFHSSSISFCSITLLSLTLHVFSIDHSLANSCCQCVSTHLCNSSV